MLCAWHVERSNLILVVVSILYFHMHPCLVVSEQIIY